MNRRSVEKYELSDGSNNVIFPTDSEGRKIWNYIKEGPLRRVGRSTPSMPSSSAFHRYVLFVLASVAAITLLVLMHGGRPPVDEILIAGFIGWLLGQLWRWEPPR